MNRKGLREKTAPGRVSRSPQRGCHDADGAGARAQLQDLAADEGTGTGLQELGEHQRSVPHHTAHAAGRPLLQPQSRPGPPLQLPHEARHGRGSEAARPLLSLAPPREEMAGGP